MMMKNVFLYNYNNPYAKNQGIRACRVLLIQARMNAQIILHIPFLLFDINRNNLFGMKSKGRGAIRHYYSHFNFYASFKCIFFIQVIATTFKMS